MKNELWETFISFIKDDSFFSRSIIDVRTAFEVGYEYRTYQKEHDDMTIIHVERRPVPGFPRGPREDKEMDTR